MFNHLVNNVSDLTDSEVEDKIIELGRKYWMTQNTDLRVQISTVLEMFKEEALVRRAKSMQRSQENDDNSLDNLINIS
jgi:hypothetical protein